MDQPGMIRAHVIRPRGQFDRGKILALPDNEVEISARRKVMPHELYPVVIEERLDAVDGSVSKLEEGNGSASNVGKLEYRNSHRRSVRATVHGASGSRGGRVQYSLSLEPAGNVAGRAEIA